MRLLLKLLCCEESDSLSNTVFKNNPDISKRLVVVFVGTAVVDTSQVLLLMLLAFLQMPLFFCRGHFCFRRR